MILSTGKKKLGALSEPSASDAEHELPMHVMQCNVVIYMLFNVYLFMFIYQRLALKVMSAEGPGQLPFASTQVYFWMCTLKPGI